MMENRHIISRQTLDISLPAAEEGYTMQNRISQQFQDRVGPALEALLDQLVPAHQYLTLDQLELNLGTLEAETLFTDEVIQKLLDQLKEKIQHILAEPSQYKAHLTSPMNHGFNSWLKYVQRGWISWAQGHPPVQWETHVLQTLRKDAATRQLFQRYLQRKPDRLTWLIKEYKETFLAALLAIYTQTEPHKLALLASELPELLTRQPHLKPSRRQALRQTPPRLWGWQQLFQETARSSLQTLSLEKLAKTILEQALLPENRNRKSALSATFTQTFPTLSALWKDRLPSYLEDPFEPEGTLAWRDTGPNVPHPGHLPTKTGDPNSPSSEGEQAQPLFAADGAEKNGISSDGEKNSLQEGETPNPQDGLPDSVDTPLWVPHGGIVLLHVFLTRFFENLGWVDQQEFVNPESQQKAVLMLHYLSTGQQEAPAYHLPLCKILCGFPLTMPLGEAPGWEESVWEEAAQLLEVAIQHWGALGEVSPDSLREGFLQRPGKLVKQEKRWHLTLEQKTIDVLLDKLPWGIGMIKLPWMKEILTVDWR
ncbi:MAG: contractile injection system tape measure protein [Bacteroidota bacterium]